MDAPCSVTAASAALLHHHAGRWMRFMLAAVLLAVFAAPGLAAEVPLTAAEEEWIAANPVVRLGVGRAFPPFQFMDKDETFQGIASDYMKLLEQRLGLRLEPQKNLTWPQVLQKTQAGEIDAWACAAPTPEREAYMHFSRPYLVFPWVIFMRQDAPLVGGIQDLDGKTVAVVRKLVNYSRLQSHDGLQFHFVPTVAKGLEAVSVGKADAYLLNLAVGDYLIRKHGLTNLRVAAPTGWGDNALAMASRRELPLLAGILQKGLDSVTQVEHDAIVSKWLQTDLSYGVPLVRILYWATGLLALGFLVIGGIFARNRRLRREIAERQRAERSLQQAYAQVDELVQERTRALLDSQNHLSMALDAVSAFTWELPVSWSGAAPELGAVTFSPNTAAALGYTDGFGDRSIQDILQFMATPEDSALALQHVQDYLLGLEPSYYREYPLFTRDGQALWYAHSGYVSGRDDKGRPRRVYGISVNIHRRKLIEEQLAAHAREQDALNARLLELDKVKSSIVTNVSHELRTPLTSLLGFATLVRKTFVRHFKPFSENASDLAQQAQRIEGNLQIIEQEGQRLTRLINDFLDLSKIQSNRIQWRDKQVEPRGLLERVAHSAQALFQDSPGIEFQVSLPPDLPPLTIDPDRLEQVVHNLLHNAWKFTEKGYVRLAASQENGSLRISVADSGPGIPDTERANIFVRFHRGKENDQPEPSSSGTGLGLSICKEIIDHYKGRIEVHSTPGQGSEFIIHLPLRPPAGSPMPQDQES